MRFVGVRLGEIGCGMMLDGGFFGILVVVMMDSQRRKLVVFG